MCPNLCIFKWSILIHKTLANECKILIKKTDNANSKAPWRTGIHLRNILKSLKADSICLMDDHYIFIYCWGTFLIVWSWVLYALTCICVCVSVVCEIGPFRVPHVDVEAPSTEGPVVVEVEGPKTGESKVLFTYRVTVSFIHIPFPHPNCNVVYVWVSVCVNGRRVKFCYVSFRTRFLRQFTPPEGLQVGVRSSPSLENIWTQLPKMTSTSLWGTCPVKCE